MKDNFLKLILNIQKDCMNWIIIYHFYQKVNKFEKIEKAFANLLHKNKYVIHIRNLKEALNHGFVLSH